MSDCGLGASGWRSVLQAMTHLSHIQTVGGLSSDFLNSGGLFFPAHTFRPSDVLLGLNWPVDLLQQPNPEEAVLQFCREMSAGKCNNPVASLLLLGPGGAGKSTLLHRLQTRTWKANLQSTDGLRVGASCVKSMSSVCPVCVCDTSTLCQVCCLSMLRRVTTPHKQQRPRPHQEQRLSIRVPLVSRTRCTSGGE